MKEYAHSPSESIIQDSGITGGIYRDRDGEGFDPKTTLLPHMASCYHLMLLYICGNMWRAWIYPIYASIHPIHSSRPSSLISAEAHAQGV